MPKTDLEQRLARIADQCEIRDVLYQYCRGIDRYDFDLVRSCYHPDATDSHGEYEGGVDGFIAHCQAQLPRFERTVHFLGNILIEIDPQRPHLARSEAYCIAHHRLRASGRTGRPARDFAVYLRYVDDFALRDGSWRIRRRVCVFDYTRMDEVSPSTYAFGPDFPMGQRSKQDAIYAPLADEDATTAT